MNSVLDIDEERSTKLEDTYIVQNKTEENMTKKIKRYL